MAKIINFNKDRKINILTRRLNRKKLKHLLCQLVGWHAICYNYQYADTQMELFEMVSRDALHVEKVIDEALQILEEGI